MTRYADEKAYVWEYFATMVEATSPRTISRDHFEYACDMLIDRVERAIEAKYNSGERTPWTKDTEAHFAARAAYTEAREQKTAALLNLACTGQLVADYPWVEVSLGSVGAVATASANAVAAGVAAGNSLSKSPRTALTGEDLNELTTMVNEWADSALPGSWDVSYEVSCVGYVMLKIWPLRP